LNIGLSVENPVKGSGSTITEANGIRVAEITAGGTNRAIRTLGAWPSEFNGGVIVGGGAAPSVAANQVGFGGTTAEIATAGTSGALPAQVAGYLIINVGGTQRKIPFYAN
jgi:hypothetical protein